jgi:uncharacterized repeat protein (TIGR02059 family)
MDMKRITGFVLACLLVLITGNLRSQNLIVNGGFEDGAEPWVFSATNESVALSQVVNDNVKSGNNALNVSVSGAGTEIEDIQLSYTGISVQKDIVYVLSFWVKSDADFYKSKVIFSGTGFSDATGVTFTKDWKKYDVIFPSPATASDIKITFQFGTFEGELYIDDISLEKKTNSWYEGADYRIDKYRKGNFRFVIYDGGGNPVSDSVVVLQKKHEFPWGVAIDLTDRPTGNTYSIAASQALIAPADSEIYRSERWASYLAYALPSETGKKYQLTIKLSENYVSGTDLRLFDTYIYGQRVIQNLDKYLIANGRFIGFDTTLHINATDTIINLEFFARKDNVSVMGMVLSDSIGQPILKLNCGGPAMTTASGNLYISDEIYIDRNSGNPNTTNDDWLKSVMLKYCNYGVCGNQFKWSGIQPTQGVLNYSPFENTLSWFNKVGWDMRAHTLLWGAQSSTNYHELPQWVGQLPPAVMYDTCKMRVQREMTRYKGKVKEYDVLNEPLHANYLQSVVGDSINWNSFKWAHEADPDAKLFINEYNVFEYQDACNRYTDLIRKMLDNGAPISGIGSQSHFGTVIDVPAIKSRIDQLAQFGIPIKVTEFDMAANDMTQQAQAIETSKMMRLTFSHPAIEGFVFWGLTDPGWRASVGNFISQDKTPKIAADSVYHLIHEAWNTKISDSTDESGLYSFRGFYGDYEISVKFGDAWKKYNVKLSKDHEDELIVLDEENALALSPVLKQVRLVEPASVELKFNKPMADPLTEFKNYKVFDVKNNTVKSASLKDGDPSTIVLTMENTITKGYYIPVSYFPGNQKSTDGAKLGSFGPVLDDRYISAFISAGTTKNGKAIAVALKKPVLDTSAHTAEFVVKVSNQIKEVVSTSVSSTFDTLFLVLAEQVISDKNTISVAYTSGSLLTAEGKYITSFSKTGTNNVIVPAFVSAATTTDGTAIQVRFSQLLADPSSQSGQFLVKVNDQVRSISDVELLGSNNRYVQIFLTSPVQTGDIVTVAYSPGSLKSAIDVPVPAFEGSVTNRSTFFSTVKEIAGNEVEIYPNPFSNRLIISNAPQYKSITISNTLGEAVVEMKINGADETIINTSGLKTGVYFVKLKSDTDSKIFKLLKN